jgi:hypothetical protein
MSNITLRFGTVALIIIALTACGKSQQEIQAEQQATAAAEAAEQAAANQAAAQAIAAKGFDATFTCGMGGTDHINILACFAGGSKSADTELEIQNGDQYGMYKAYNLSGVGVEDQQGFHIHLQPHFAIKAQNSQPTLMLGLTIKDANGKVVFQQSAAQYGVISVRN